jgi:hypothetical protein
MAGPVAPMEKVGLGTLGKHANDPTKKYDADRYTQTTEKTFRFAMALRTDVSHIQLGYRIALGTHNIPLIEYSVAPGLGTLPRFPTQPISAEIRSEDWPVYDVHQSSVFSTEDEDVFEGCEPEKWKSPFHVYQVISSERIFLNERKGKVALKVDVKFDADLNSPAQPFVGYATVTIRNLEPSKYRDGIILPVKVFETRVIDKHGSTEEFLADHMTVHIVPSFLVVGGQYFEDRQEAGARMARFIDEIDQKYPEFQRPPRPGPIDPEWKARLRPAEELLQLQAIEQFAREQPAAAGELLHRFDRSATRKTTVTASARAAANIG